MQISYYNILLAFINYDFVVYFSRWFECVFFLWIKIIRITITAELNIVYRIQYITVRYNNSAVSVIEQWCGKQLNRALVR